MEKIEEETKVAFSKERMNAKELAAYEQMETEVLSKKYGEPLDIATHIFKKFETEDFKHKLLRNDLTS